MASDEPHTHHLSLITAVWCLFCVEINVLARLRSKFHCRRMNFPKFWARGQNGDFICWRWSSTTFEEAQALANEAARLLAERFRAGQRPSKKGGYYPDRPFREQVLREMKSAAGDIAAVVTRNSYGCLVLNTSQVMFVDIDLPEPKVSRGFFSSLFGKPDLTPPRDVQGDVIRNVENWSQAHPEWGWRVYRTRAGLRLMATHGLVDANSPLAIEVFGTFGADPLYQKLCQSQKCYRARLTPKPWRCGVNRKPDRWPWLEPKAEKRFQNWETEYNARSSSWSTCELVRQIGNREVHSEIAPILSYHDTTTRIGTGLQLA